MTLQQFFEWVQANPMYILYYFVGLFVVTFILNAITQDEYGQSPWKYMYSALIYLVCIPGIFAISLSIYFFLFEKRSIMDTEILLQVLPVVASFFIMYFVKKHVNLDYIPGVERLSGLVTIISVVLALMWMIDRTHIFIFSVLPFYVILLVIAVGIFLIRSAMRSF